MSKQGVLSLLEELLGHEPKVDIRWESQLKPRHTCHLTLEWPTGKRKFAGPGDSKVNAEKAAFKSAFQAALHYKKKQHKQQPARKDFLERIQNALTMTEGDTNFVGCLMRVGDVCQSYPNYNFARIIDGSKPSGWSVRVTLQIDGRSFKAGPVSVDTQKQGKQDVSRQIILALRKHFCL